MSANAAKARAGEATLGALFSIDVDAELGKICGRSYSSPHHYPVELVRAALARGATRVALHLSRQRLAIDDDGAPLGAEIVADLARLLDRTASSEQRQQALYEVEQHATGGLLAMFAPAPSAIELRTGDGGAGRRLRLRHGRLTLDDRAAINRGTAIAIARRGDPEQECAVLRDYCRFAAAEIRVDGALVSGAGNERAVLAAAVVPGWSGVQRCEIELPVDGDLCRVFRLVHGIVKQRWTGESTPHLVYQVIVECAGDLPDDFVGRLLAAAHALYVEVVGRYPRLAATERDRVDELIFRHYRADPKTPLIGQLAAFRRHGSDQRLTLDQVRQRAEHGLCAVVESEDVARYDLADAEVVELTPRQRDFLEHDAGIKLPAPLLRPAPPGRWRSAVAALRSRARRAWRALTFWLGRAQVGVPDPTAAKLMLAIQGAIESGRFALPRTREQCRIEVVWSVRRGRAPCLIKTSGERGTLVLNGKHRVLQQAVIAFARDSGNLVFILPALLDGHDGWQG